MEADLVFRGGTVLTLDEADTTATALAVLGGRIVAVGGDAAVSAHIGPRTRVEDISGRAVLPGINDTHMHAAWVGATWPMVFFSDDPPAFDQRLVSTEEERLAALLGAADVAASFGITSYTEPGIGPGEDHGPTGAMGTATLRLYQRLAREGRLKQRVNLLMLFGPIDGPSNLAGLVEGLADYDTATPDPRRFRVAGVKIFADGVPITQTSWVHCHYADGSQGRLTVEGADEAARAEALRRMVVAALRAGHQVGVHATGDRSIDTILDAVAEADVRDQDLRPYVIHGDLATPAQLDRMAELGVGVTYQAGIGTATEPWVSETLGAARARAGWAYAEAWRRGVPASLSSDAPFLSLDWRREVANADAWMGPAGDQRARLTQLLRAWTAIPAWFDHAESWKGVIGVGQAADLVVLDRAPTCAAEMPAVEVDATYLDGLPTYRRGLAPRRARLARPEADRRRPAS